MNSHCEWFPQHSEHGPGLWQKHQSLFCEHGKTDGIITLLCQCKASEPDHQPALVCTMTSAHIHLECAVCLVMFVNDIAEQVRLAWQPTWNHLHSTSTASQLLPSPKIRTSIVDCVHCCVLQCRSLRTAQKSNGTAKTSQHTLTSKVSLVKWFEGKSQCLECWNNNNNQNLSECTKQWTQFFCLIWWFDLVHVFKTEVLSRKNFLKVKSLQFSLLFFNQLGSQHTKIAAMAFNLFSLINPTTRKHCSIEILKLLKFRIHENLACTGWSSLIRFNAQENQPNRVSTTIFGHSFRSACPLYANSSPLHLGIIEKGIYRLTIISPHHSPREEQPLHGRQLLACWPYLGRFSSCR